MSFYLFSAAHTWHLYAPFSNGHTSETLGCATVGFKLPHTVGGGNKLIKKRYSNSCQSVTMHFIVKLGLTSPFCLIGHIPNGS